MNPTSLLDALQPLNWTTLVLVSARVAGFTLSAPLWSLGVIPARVRASIAVVMSLALLPLAPSAALPVDAPSVVIPMGAELLLGLAIGLSAAFFLHAVSVAAEVISLQMGLSLGVAFGGTADMGSPGIGQLHGQFTLAVYVAMGGYLAMVAGLARSFLAIPPGSPIVLAAGGQAMVTMAAMVFRVAVQVAAPTMVALLITNLALALLNRAVPQLNTMMVAVPITVAVGLIALGGSLPIAAGLVSRWAASVGSTADHVVDRFAPAGARP